jgi:hypothetical protein
MRTSQHSSRGLTSDLFNSGKELGGLQPLSFQVAAYTGIAR